LNYITTLWSWFNELAENTNATATVSVDLPDLIVNGETITVNASATLLSLNGIDTASGDPPGGGSSIKWLSLFRQLTTLILDVGFLIGSYVWIMTPITGNPFAKEEMGFHN